ncbi:uncharacterized protein LOC143833987 isoform X4 [Paroedura picta]|uniref:uncharacterized protein LOC143833987 isoform X4 n=1 Tax=Paroedura picta TaxID=143630 RepID=UPI0040579ED7
MATLNWPFQIVLQQGVNPAVKNMGPPQTRPPEEDSVIPRVIQVGTIGEFLGCEAPPKLTQGPEEGLAQCWEAQWQEVLKAVQPLTTGQETPQPLRTSAWDDTRDSSEVISDTGQWPTGEGDPQLLAEDDRDGLQVMSDPDNGGNGTTEEEAVRKEARDAEMQRQYFRQLHYQEGEGPRKLCVRLQEFCRGWLRPERHTKEQILELVVLEQFLAVLPQEIQSWLRNCGPQACSHAVALAEDFLRDEQQEDKMVAPCDVVLASSDQEWSPLDSRLRYFGGEAQTEDRRDSSLTGKARCLHVYPISPGEGSLNGNNWGPSQQGGSGPPVPVGLLSGQFGWLEGRRGPQQAHETEPPPTWEEITYCGEGGYETEVRLEDHKQWCLECGESFLDVPQLVEHQKAHAHPRRPECPKCGKSFRDVSHVIRHQTVHTGEKPFSCLECGQTFTQKPALRRHQEKHRGGNGDLGAFHKSTRLNPVESAHRVSGPSRENASSTLANRSRAGHQPLKKHHGDLTPNPGGNRLLKKNLSRRGQKNHWCLTCGKGFRDKADVIRHQRVHTGEKPFECLTCGKRFAASSTLYKHRLVHKQPDLKPG